MNTMFLQRRRILCCLEIVPTIAERKTRGTVQNILGDTPAISLGMAGLSCRDKQTADITNQIRKMKRAFPISVKVRKNNKTAKGSKDIYVFARLQMSTSLLIDL